jgi:hypothetical protein
MFFRIYLPLPLLILFVSFFIGCEEKETFYDRVSSRKGYSLEILTTMDPSTSLNDEASLQFFDESRQLFLIVLDEGKEEMDEALDVNAELSEYYTSDFDGYTDFLLDNFAYMMEVKTRSEMKNTSISGLSAKTIDLVCELDGTDILYSLAFIEGKEKYYQIWTWTYANKERKNQPLMYHIINSFQEKN